MLAFAKKHNVGTIATIGGYRMETQGKPKVIVAGTNQQILIKPSLQEQPFLPQEAPSSEPQA